MGGPFGARKHRAVFLTSIYECLVQIHGALRRLRRTRVIPDMAVCSGREVNGRVGWAGWRN